MDIVCEDAGCFYLWMMELAKTRPSLDPVETMNRIGTGPIKYGNGFWLVNWNRISFYFSCYWPPFLEPRLELV